MNTDIMELLKEKWYIAAIPLILFVLLFVALVVMDKAPVRNLISNYRSRQALISEIAEQKAELDRILEDNKRKKEASQKATIKEFYKISDSGDVKSDFSPMFENIITMIKQNGLRMKSINYNMSPEGDNLIKNGGGAYSGCRVDFELVGYYPQFTALLNDFDLYPYFISIGKFEVQPYQYDKRILIANISVVFYAKRN